MADGDMIFQNLSVLERTGPDLRAATWAQAYGTLSTYSGNYTNQETFSAAKRDGGDQYRIWSFDGGSFHIDTGWRP